MRRLIPIGLALMSSAASLLAQAPAPAAVLNPASNTLAGLPNSGIAQGAIFVVYGKNLGPATLAQASSIPLPTTAGLSGTSIQVTVGSTTVDAPMIYTLATQVAAVLPSTAPVGSGTLKLTYNGQSGTTPITVVKSNFGISTLAQTGSGPAVVTRPNYQVITLTNSAKPGETLVLWGTGLGPITGNDAAVPTGGDLGTNIQVLIGGQSATISYRGRSGAPGLDQINFVVPQGLSGCYVSLATQTGTTVSNFTTIPIAANGGACSDPTGLPISALPASGTIKFGYVDLTQSTTTTPAIGPLPASTTTSTSASASFTKFTTDQLVNSASLTGQPSLGGCSVLTFSGTNAPTVIPKFTGLNAGPNITVTGPANYTLNPTSGTVGDYSASSTAALPAGTYKATNGSGGSDVGAFNATLNVATPLTWTNQADAASVDRSQPFTVKWTGGDNTAFASITGFSLSSATNGVGAFFTCIAPVSPGQFTIPSSVLLSLPPSVTVSGFSTGNLSVGSYSNPAPFTASGLDFAYTLSGAMTSIVNAYK